MLIVEHSYTSMTLLFLSNMVTLLRNFGEATGLKTNLSKSSIKLIRCDDIDIPSIMDDFLATIAPFPIKYLGLSLSLGRLLRADLQPFIDRAVEGEISKAGCAELVHSVLIALPTFPLIALKVDMGTLKAFNKICRGILWDCCE
jgi:hypothetical protein